MPAPKFPELEEKMLALWEKEGLFEKTLAKTKNGPPFVFFEGPPTANGKPGLHHVIARAFKDAVPRYKTMRGFRVDRKAGWDTHGLPVELQVEKTLGISGKPQIENIVPGDARASIIEFNKKCKESVWQYKDVWETITRRMGFWLDMAQPYVTYENSYIESLWSIFKKVWQRGLLYQGYKVVPHCARCGTALSSHEVAQGYKNIEEDSVYLKFKVGGEAQTYFLSWTTTPWTLPGNVALAVGEKINYAKIKVGAEIYILAAELVETVFAGQKYEQKEVLPGSALVGKKYEPLFPFLLSVLTPEQAAKAYQIYAADFVTTTDGTGIVHTAVMYGEDDYQLGQKIGLPAVHTVGEDGNFLPLVKPWAGKFVKAVEPEIVVALQQQGALLKTQKYAHDYPFCWRCGTPLLYYAKNSWFIKMSALSAAMVSSNQTVHWVPDYIKEGRFGEWLRGVKDWAVSRERYWGTPLPIWRCDKCGEFEVLGSAAELQKKTGAKLEDLHRPFVDDPTYQCVCGGTRGRVKEVLDVWFDSGAMFVAQWGYQWGEKGTAQKDFAEHFPADYISEAIDQTRGWFYTLLAIATLLEQPAPYKNVICLGHILDAHGQKMSKSKGNVLDPAEMFAEFGADAVRWHLYSLSQAGEPKIFDKKGVTEVVKKVFLILWNVLEFYKLYPSKTAGYSAHPLDVWLQNRVQRTVNEVTDSLEKYELTDATRNLAELINEVSTWFVRRSRGRFKSGGKDAAAAAAALRAVLETISKLMAPFTPMTADAIYREVMGEKESVHLSAWPKTENYEAEILQNMAALRDLVTRALEQRAAAGIPVRQVLSSLLVPPEAAALQPLFEILREEVNVETVLVGTELKLDVNLTPELKERGLARELIRLINAARKDAGLKPGQAARAVVAGDEGVLAAAKNHLTEIKKATVCDLDLVAGVDISVKIG